MNCVVRFLRRTQVGSSPTVVRFATGLSLKTFSEFSLLELSGKAGTGLPFTVRRYRTVFQYLDPLR
jgi:DNA-binding MurR/RpiR family transcriptional regulator